MGSVLGTGFHHLVMSLLVVDIFSVCYPQYEYEDFVVFDLANDPVISNAVSP